MPEQSSIVLAVFVCVSLFLHKNLENYRSEIDVVWWEYVPGQTLEIISS